MGKKLVLLLMFLSVTMLQTLATEEHVGDRVPLKKGEPTLREQVIIVPAGTKFQALTTCELNSNVLLTGQTVTLALPSDFYFKGNLIAPKGSILTGNVVEAARARQNGQNGKVNMRFSLITTPYGLQIPVAAMIKTKDTTGVLVGSENPVQKQDVVAINKKIETVLLKSVWNFGDEVSVPIETTLDIVLTQPITVNPTVYSSKN